MILLYLLLAATPLEALETILKRKVTKYLVIIRLFIWHLFTINGCDPTIYGLVFEEAR